MDKISEQDSRLISKKRAKISPTEASVQFMLTEYNRITEVEIYNRNTGESRVKLYLTLVSLVGAGLVALRQATDIQKTVASQEFYCVSFIALFFVSLVGIIVLKLLLERWRLTVIYLRKLARIRRWFTELDPTLHGGLAYSTDETKPTFASKGLLSSSLVTLILVVNGLPIAGSILFIVLLFKPTMSILSTIILCGIIVTVVWLLQLVIAWKRLNSIEKAESAEFHLKQEKKG
jgi:hypothetical protein